MNYNKVQRKNACIKQEKIKPYSNEYGFYRGDWNLTDGERALNLRAFCDSQNLGEQFGEQTAIFEQVLPLFEKLDADQKKSLLGMLTDRMEVMND